MKFHCSEFWTFDKRPYPWCDMGLSEKETVEKYLERYVKVYDADICGNVTIDFVFDSGKAYRLDYSWWIDIEGDQWLCDEEFIEEIPISDAKNCMTKFRDIMGVNPKYSGLPRAEA